MSAVARTLRPGDTIVWLDRVCVVLSTEVVVPMLIDIVFEGGGGILIHREHTFPTPDPRHEETI